MRRSAILDQHTECPLATEQRSEEMRAIDGFGTKVVVRDHAIVEA